MSRRAARTGNSAAVSLFPFLAVLICTMGSLIVLLVIVVQQARVEAADDVQETAAAPPAPTRDAEADSERLVNLLMLRDQGAEQLAAMRLVLAEIEDHSRVLEDELAQLDAQQERLAAGRTDGDDVDRLAAEQAWLEQQIEQARAERDQAQQQQARRKRSYAIIPYAGPQGTRRRPIYIECLADRVILQPEGIELLESDFRPPLGPGNALAAALRATREYWAEQNQLGNGGEPYPLLLVRPDGARSYAAAREAMKSWDDEFGYELIDADMQLAFPPSDARLDIILQRSLADARARQEFLVQSAPARFGRESGGSGGWGTETSGGLGGTSAAGTGVPGSGGSGTGGPSGDLAWDTGSGAGGTSGTTPGAGSGAPGGTQPGEPGAGYAAGTRPGGSAASGSESRGGGTSPYDSGDPTGGSGTSEGRSQAVAAGSSSGGSESGAGGSVGSGGNFAADPGASSAAGGSAASGAPRLADTRGSNWGLPSNDGTTIGYSRPIQVGLDQTSLTIHRESDDLQRQPIVVPLDRGTVSGSIDQFVAEVWTYMEDWGHAGPGSFWKPVLNVQVAPGAEARYEELARLLEGSGIEVTRK